MSAEVRFAARALKELKKLDPVARKSTLTNVQKVNMTLHPQIIEKDGVETFAVLPIEEYRAIQEMLEDMEDLRALNEAKAENADRPTLSLEEVQAKYG